MASAGALVRTMRRREFLAGSLAIGAFGDSWIRTRPRLFYNDSLTARVRSHAAGTEPWSRFIAHANELVNANLISQAAAEQGRGDDAHFRPASQQITDMAFTLGLAYHVTGHKAYEVKLREAILHYAAYSAWHGPGFAKRTPPWHAELNTAGFCMGMGTGYDALYNQFSAAERHTVAAAIIRMGILPTLEDWLAPRTRIHALDSMGHNWWAVCISSAGVAALALVGDDEKVPAWLELINDGLVEWFPYAGNVLQNKTTTFAPGGGYYEGVGYANYALSEYLRYRLAHRNVFPGRKQAHFEQLENVCEFFCETFYPSSVNPLSVNFGDSSMHQQVRLTMRMLIESGFQHPGAGWYFAKSKSLAPIHPPALDFLFQQPVPAPETPRLPRSIFYPDIGWAILRDSWNDDTTMLAVKSGFTWNHA
ncbi:MAG: hypothetical protein ACRD19_17000, partial [Terriglobia bacterium]